MPDIVHTGPDYAPFFANRKSKLVVTFHSFVWDNETEQYSTPLQRLHHQTDLRWFVKKALKVADRVTCVSNFTAELVRNEFNYNKEISVIYNGIDTAKFQPVESPANKQVQVLYSGNLTRRKGADLLPLIAERLHENITLIYTSGLSSKTTLPALPNLKNIGSIPHDDMPKAYQDADILILPSVREGFGLAVAEAMACGLPVVASNCSSIPELLVDGKGGYFCEVGDVEAFTDKINYLASSFTLRKEMGIFNRKRAAKLFAIDRMVEEYNQIFEQVLA